MKRPLSFWIERAQRSPRRGRQVETSPGTSTEGSGPRDPVILDHKHYAQIFNAIIAAASASVLFHLRNTSKTVRELVDTQICSHVVVEGRNLRTRRGQVYFEIGDPRIASAEILDLPSLPRVSRMKDVYIASAERSDCMERFLPLLYNVRLLRVANSEGLNSDYAARRISEVAHSALWIVHHLDATPKLHLAWVQPRAYESLLPSLDSTTKRANYVINISYLPDYPEWTEAALDIFIPARPETVFIVFSPAFTPTRVPSCQRPFYPQLLNTLARRLIVEHKACIVLVGVDSWSHSWLNRTFELQGVETPTSHLITAPPKIQVVEDTPPDADLRVWLTWWLRMRAETLGWEPNQVDCAVKNVTFISMAEFRERVPSEAMYRNIMSV